jgi:hypothetical protein
MAQKLDLQQVTLSPYTQRDVGMATNRLIICQAKKAIAALYKKNKQNDGNDMLQNDEDSFIYVEIHTHKIMNKAQSKQKQM